MRLEKHKVCTLYTKLYEPRQYTLAQLNNCWDNGLFICECVCVCVCVCVYNLNVALMV